MQFQFLHSLLKALLLGMCLAAIAAERAHATAVAPAEIAQRIARGEAVDVIVEYESSDVDKEAVAARAPSERFDSDAVLALRARRYAGIKRGADSALAQADIATLRDYSHLPISFKRIRSAAALQALLALPRVKAVYANRALHRAVASNLTLISQPSASNVGYSGSGSTVAVLDDGIDYTNGAFGGCTAPGTPATCAVSVSRQFGTGTTDNSHGTNVSAIVLAVAPAARIAMLNVFSGTSAYAADIIGAMNWSIQNRSTYNIVAMNLSLGDSSQNTSPCSSGNPYLTPVNNARNAGITVVAASGNDAYSNALVLPACTPGVVSVGAVYAENYNGGFTWGNNVCTDYSTAPDQITCFSNSASFLTLLAPGAMITAAGITEGGTSQAAPHVAGAVAVLRSAFPGETLNATANRLTTSRTMLTDARNSVVKPRLDVEAAARPANDGFSAAVIISGSSGKATGTNRLATRESGEPLIAANESGRSVWWTWVAPASGQVSLDTHGSGFDTVLSVSTGSAVNALQVKASNDDDGSSGHASGLLFQAVNGTAYRIAVDGMNGDQGSIALNWSLNTAAQANLSVSGISGPAAPVQGSQVDYAITVSNSGPQAATHVQLTLSLPGGVSLRASSATCQGSTGQVVCDLGDLGNGASSTLQVTLLWNASGTQNLSAAVASDVPDSAIGNNSASVALTTQIAVDDIADTPTLPEWAAIMLISFLFLLMARAHTRSQPPGSGVS